MTSKISLALLALSVAAVPASAQLRTTDRVRDVILGRDRVETRTDTRRGGTMGDVIYGRTTDDGASTRVPKGHLPPAGMCRVWIDGVPPGRQPAPTSCAQAQSDRVQYGTRARVLYGDDEAFPGKGKGKFRNAQRRDDVGATARRRGTVIDRRGAVIDGDDDDGGDAGARKAKGGKGRGKRRPAD